jgi:hypothetical protein
MATTLVELMEWLKTLDEVTLLELLDISAEDLIEQFADRVEDQYPRLLSEKELMNE